MVLLKHVGGTYPLETKTSTVFLPQSNLDTSGSQVLVVSLKHQGAFCKYRVNGTALDIVVYMCVQFLQG